MNFRLVNNNGKILLGEVYNVIGSTEEFVGAVKVCGLRVPRLTRSIEKKIEKRLKEHLNFHNERVNDDEFQEILQNCYRAFDLPIITVEKVAVKRD